MSVQVGFGQAAPWTQSIPAAKPSFGDEEVAAVTRVLRSGSVSAGAEVGAFEDEFSRDLVAGRTCVALSSGTAGLHLGLLAAGVGPGDEVIVPSFTFAATANAVALTGATPVFVDIEPEHFCLDPDAVLAAIGPRTVAVMPVHLFGHPADLTKISSIANQHGLAVFEDAAQAHGALWNGAPVGSFGEFGMFSLYPTKNMTAGEGGMNSCRDEAFARQLRLLRNQGMERRYANEIVGFNARMTDLHAAIGRVQLAKLPHWTAQRRANAAFFDANLVGVITPVVAAEAEHVYHQYTVRVPGDRDGFADTLLRQFGVGSGVYYPTPVHQLPAYKVQLDLPVTAATCADVLALPVHPGVSADDLDRIVTAVNTLAAAGA